MNAYESRIEPDYANDLHQVWLRKWQEREIRRRQLKALVERVHHSTYHPLYPDESPKFVGGMSCKSDCPRCKFASLIPQIEREMQALVASKITEFGTLKQAAVEAEREACAENVAAILTCPSHGHGRHHDCVDCHRIGTVYRDIRSRGSRNALDEMIAAAEQRGYERGRKDE